LQIAILAGGLGTRLHGLTKNVPKPMIQVNGRPFLEYEIGLLRRGGIRDFVLCVGYLGEMVEEYFKDGKKWGVRIRYSYDKPRLMGPAGALKGAATLLEENFFVTYGDAYLRTNYRSVMGALRDSGKLGLMTVYRNRNRYGVSDVEVSGGRVIRYEKEDRGGRMEWVNFGVTALRKPALDLIPAGKVCSEQRFYGELIRLGELLAFPVEDRFYEIGSPESLREFELFIMRQP